MNTIKKGIKDTSELLSSFRKNDLARIKELEADYQDSNDNRTFEDWCLSKIE